VKICCLDTSALNDLLEPNTVLVRHRLIDEVNARRIVVLGTAPLLLEMSGTYDVDAARHVAMIDLFHRISRGSNLLLDPVVRRERELRAGRALVYPAFVESNYEPSFEANAVQRAAAFATGCIRGMRFLEAEKASEAVRTLDDRERQLASARGELSDPSDPAWRRTLKVARGDERFMAQLVEDFARAAIDACAHRLRIENAAGLNPRDLPTFWQSASIHVARIHAVIVGRTSPTGRKSAGQVDLLHLDEAASYADVFVTSDRRLRAFAKTVRELRCEVLSFTEWAGGITC
jgi:hypothetical protein